VHHSEQSWKYDARIPDTGNLQEGNDNSAGTHAQIDMLQLKLPLPRDRTRTKPGMSMREHSVTPISTGSLSWELSRLM
jgi:hypothetical protein